MNNQELLTSAHSILSSLAAGSFVKDASPEDYEKGITGLTKRAGEWVKAYEARNDDAEFAAAAVALGEAQTGAEG